MRDKRSVTDAIPVSWWALRLSDIPGGIELLLTRI